MSKELKAAIAERKRLQANFKKLATIAVKKKLVAPVRTISIRQNKNGLLESVEELLTPSRRIANS